MSTTIAPPADAGALPSRSRRERLSSRPAEAVARACSRTTLRETATQTLAPAWRALLKMR